jgi:hypothetical protein
MPGGDRKDLAVQALARPATVSDLYPAHARIRKSLDEKTRKLSVT